MQHMVHFIMRFFPQCNLLVFYIVFFTLVIVTQPITLDGFGLEQFYRLLG